MVQWTNDKRRARNSTAYIVAIILIWTTIITVILLFGNGCASQLTQQEVRVACEGLIHEVRHKIQDDKIIELNKTIEGNTLYIRRLQLQPKGFKELSKRFLGSGSTLIACEKTDRKCFGLEIDEHYCDVVLKRWEDFTGKKGILDG